MNLLLKNFFSTLRRYKVASALNVVGLGVAFAAFAIIMMQVRYDLTYDHSQPEHERIFRYENEGFGSEMFSPFGSDPMFELMATSFPQVEAIGVWLPNDTERKFRVASASESEFPFELGMEEVNDGWFEVFDYQWIAGDASGFVERNAVVVAQSIADQIFGEGSAVGQSIVQEGKEGEPLTIVGVYRDFPQNATLGNVVYRYRAIDPSQYWGYQNQIGFLRLHSADQAPGLTKQIAQALNEQKFIGSSEAVVRLTSLRDTHYLTDTRYDPAEPINAQRTWLFMMIAVLIVAIALINFNNFSNALVPTRLRAINTQKVFGCSIATIRSMMLFEAVGICLIAVALAIWLVAILAESGVADLMIAPIGWGANLPLLFGVIGAAIVAGLLAGIYPAFNISSFPTALALKGSFGLTPRGKRVRQLLISFQYVISIGLIIVALFIHVQSNYMKTMPIGFDRDHLMQMEVPRRLFEQQDALRAELLANPAVREMGFSNLPLVTELISRHGTGNNEDDFIFWDHKGVSATYPATLGLQIVAGRDFLPEDQFKEHAVMLMSRTAMERYGLEPGRMIDNRTQVVGFFADINYKPAREGIEPLGFELWKPGGRFRNLDYLYLRIAPRDVASTIDHIRATARRLDPSLSDVDVRFVDEQIADIYAKEDKLARLITLFSLVAIVISMIGIFGLVLFEGRFRRKEIGIRKVHGATISQVLELLNRGFVRIVLVCFVVAAPIAWYAITKWRSDFAYQSPVPWWIFAVALLAVLLLTLLTVTLQSYRSATENPINSIKTE